MDIKIVVATHKKYQMPKDDMYIPLHVGREGKNYIGYTGDHTGDNISSSNLRLCELTGMYWAWKNLQADYIGLVHYRRYFTLAGKMKRLFYRNKFQLIASKKDMEKILSQTDVIVPNKRKYYIETMESHFLHLPYTYEKDYRVFSDVIQELSPEYMGSFKKVMNGTSAHMFNMFVMKRDLFNQYCKWLFPIILEVDQRINVTGYDRMQARAVAYYGEFMLDVWMNKNRISYKEVPVVFMEKQSMVRKAWSVLKRKFGINLIEKKKRSV